MRGQSRDKMHVGCGIMRVRTAGSAAGVGMWASIGKEKGSAGTAVVDADGRSGAALVEIRLDTAGCPTSEETAAARATGPDTECVHPMHCTPTGHKTAWSPLHSSRRGGYCLR